MLHVYLENLYYIIFYTKILNIYMIANRNIHVYNYLNIIRTSWFLTPVPTPQTHHPPGDSAAAALWSPGPAKLETAAAKRVQKHLQYDPLLVLVDETVRFLSCWAADLLWFQLSWFFVWRIMLGLVDLGVVNLENGLDAGGWNGYCLLSRSFWLVCWDWLRDLGLGKFLKKTRFFSLKCFQIVD